VALHELSIALGPAFIKLNVPSIGPPQCLQCFLKGRHPRLSFGVPRNSDQYGDPARLTQLLRARYERPRRRTADQSDELATAAHSITSSARAMNVGVSSRPSALAVFRLTARLNFVGSSTGRSAGLVP